MNGRSPFRRKIKKSTASSQRPGVSDDKENNVCLPASRHDTGRQARFSGEIASPVRLERVESARTVECIAAQSTYPLSSMIDV